VIILSIHYRPELALLRLERLDAQFASDYQAFEVLQVVDMSGQFLDMPALIGCVCLGFDELRVCPLKLNFCRAQIII
jgi:hypothetical protein